MPQEPDPRPDQSAMTRPEPASRPAVGGDGGAPARGLDVDAKQRVEDGRHRTGERSTQGRARNPLRDC